MPDRHDDLLPDGSLGQLDPAHHHHGLETAEQLARGVGVHRGHRTGVTGVHGLEHVERLRATALTDDDAVGPHTQRVADEVADADLAAPLGVGGPGLEGDDVGPLDLELGRLLDRDEALAVGDEVGQDVQHRGLPGAGAADHHHADLAPHQCLEEHGGVHGERSRG